MDERDLVDRMRRGEQRAFDHFFDSFAARLGAFAACRSPFDAAALEDVVQMTMIKAMRSLETFRGDSTLFTWLCQICRNHLVDVSRKAARQPQIRSLEQISKEGPMSKVVQLTEFRGPLEECVADSERGAVRRALSRLPTPYARVLELRFGGDLTVPQIAQALQISESAAESRLARARRAFRAEWQRDAEPCQSSLT